MAIATTTQRNTLAAAYGTAATYAALFTADPGTSGSTTGEVSGGTYARKAVTWSAASNGSITTQVTFNVPAGTTVTHVGFTSASTGGNLLDRYAITSQTFSVAGTITVTNTYVQS